MFRYENGEFHVVGATGVVYCAPQFIVHYIAEHQYQPPQEFIEAVLYQRGLRHGQKHA